jgi:hypothetical protein
VLRPPEIVFLRIDGKPAPANYPVEIHNPKKPAKHLTIGWQVTGEKLNAESLPAPGTVSLSSASKRPTRLERSSAR